MIPSGSTALFATVPGIPSWQPHPEVWLLILSVIGLGVYVSRVMEPLAVAAGHKPLTSHQKRWFVLAVVVLWIASDWPLHDIAEERLYTMHMVQHMLMTVVFPPVILMAIPEWLGQMILGDGRVNRTFRWLARPVPAAVGYNVLAGITHWNLIVNTSVRSGPFHYTLHTLLVFTALLIWTPICGPFPELRLSEPGKMIYIFLMSLIPTIPAAFLTASEGVLYSSYDHGPRLWGLSVIGDQQMAGVVMKIVEGFYLWVIILVMFLRWMRPASAERFHGRLVERPPSRTPAAGVVSGAASVPVTATAATAESEGRSRVPAEAPSGQNR